MFKLKTEAAAISESTVSMKYSKSFNKRKGEAVIGIFLTAERLELIVVTAECTVLTEYRNSTPQPKPYFLLTDGLQGITKKTNKPLSTPKKPQNKPNKKTSIHNKTTNEKRTERKTPNK